MSDASIFANFSLCPPPTSGCAHAAFYPGVVPSADSQPVNNFLDTLWQPQSTETANKGQAELKAFLQGVEEPDRLLRFESNLLQSAKLASTSQGQEQDAKFLAELVRLGKDYAALNPSPPADLDGEQPHLFLNSLWQVQPEYERQTIDAAALELSQFLSPFTVPAQRSQVLELECNLLELVKQIPELQPQLQDATFVQELLGIGQLYAALKFSDLSTAEEQPNASFLDSLWRGEPIQGEALQQAQKLFDGLGVAVGNPKAVLLALRLAIVNERRSEIPELPESADPPTEPSPDLTLQIGQLAGAYAALNPESSGGTLNFFLDTVWSSDNSAEPETLEKIRQGAIELQAFLTGGQEHKGFSPEDQPQVLEFETKLLKAAQMTSPSVLGARQRQDPEILEKLFVEMGRNVAQSHLSGAQSLGSAAFLDTLWNADVEDDQAIQQGVTELEQYLEDFGIPIDTLGYFSKMLLALDRVDEKLGADFEDFLRELQQNLGLILLLVGSIAALQFVPFVNVAVDLVLLVIDVIFTLISGVQSIKALLDFFFHVEQATDETGIDSAAADFAQAIESGSQAIVGLVVFAKAFPKLVEEVPKLLKAIKLLKLCKAEEIIPVGQFLLQFGRNEEVLTFLGQADEIGLERLIDIIKYLEDKSSVTSLLAKSPQLLQEVLSGSLAQATTLIDDLATLLTQVGDEATLLDLLTQMSIADLQGFLTQMSIADLQGFLSQMSIADLQGFLTQMSVADLQGFLAQMSVADLQGFLAQMPATDLQALLSIRGMTLEVLSNLLGKLPISELKKFKSLEGINLEFLQGLFKGGGITGNLNIIERTLRTASNLTNPQHLSAQAELRVAKQLLSEGENVFFIDNNANKGKVGPGISNDMTLLGSGTQVDVKRLSGIGRNAAGDISKGVRQVGHGGQVIVVRASDSANTIEQFQQFISGFKPKDPSVSVRVIDESDLPQLGEP